MNNQFRIILNIDGYQKIKIKGSGNSKIDYMKLNEIDNKLNDINDKLNIELPKICFVINCYINNHRKFHNFNEIVNEILAIYQSYNININSDYKIKIEKYLNYIQSKANNPSTINKKFDNIEFIYCKHNGGIANNRNKFIENLDVFFKTSEQKQYKWVLMLDDSDFVGFKYFKILAKYINQIENDNNFYSIGVPCGEKGPGHISFWEHIYKTKFLNKFINPISDIGDDGVNKLLSKDKFCFDIIKQISKDFNLKYKYNEIYECFKWCNYNGLSSHYNPPAIYLNDNQICMYPNIPNYDINYLSSYYYILLIIGQNINNDIILKIKNLNGSKDLIETYISTQNIINNQPIR